MAFHHSPKIVTNGLVLCLDAANRKSYSGTGTVWRDLAGSNNGTLTNGPTFSSANGGSIVFDGSNDYVEVNNDASLNMTNSFSICCWVFFNTNSMTKRVIFTGKGDGNSTSTTQYWLEKGSDNQIIFYCSINGSDSLFFSGYKVASNNWYYVTGIYSGTVQTVFINGLRISSKSITGPLTVTNIIHSVGKLGTYNSLHLDGRISQTTIYNRALSPAEILQNYNATKGRYNL